MGKSAKSKSGANSKSSASKPQLNCGTYVIQKSDTGQKYVGRSSDVARRVEQHNAGNGAKWTAEAGAGWEIVKVYPGNNNATETAITKGVMRNEGIANVRGGPYTKTHYPITEFRAIKNANGFTNLGNQK